MAKSEVEPLIFHGWKVKVLSLCHVYVTRVLGYSVLEHVRLGGPARPTMNYGTRVSGTSYSYRKKDCVHWSWQNMSYSTTVPPKNGLESLKNTMFRIKYFNQKQLQNAQWNVFVCRCPISSPVWCYYESVAIKHWRHNIYLVKLKTFPQSTWCTKGRSNIPVKPQPFLVRFECSKGILLILLKWNYSEYLLSVGCSPNKSS